MSESNNMTMGILGGGQLARMLAEAAVELNIPVNVLAKETEESVYGLNDVKYYSYKNQNDFALHSQVLCFESEFFDEKQVESLIHVNPSLMLRPSLATIKILRDKLDQKLFFDRESLAQSRFVVVPNDINKAATLIKFAQENFSKGAVLKRSFGGYDGKGNYFLSAQFLNSFDPNQSEYLLLEEFIKSSFEAHSRLYLEEMIPFERELAVVAFPSKQGITIFPIVESLQIHGICKEVWGPYSSEKVNSQIVSIINKIAFKFPDLGVFAVEFFEWNGQVIINEMAPRVHNSAHYTRLFHLKSQFHAHVSSLVDKNIEILETRCDSFVMRNLLAPESWNYQAPKDIEKIFNDIFGELEDRVWYHKSQLKSFRKLGHVSVSCSKSEDIQFKRLHLKNLEEKFWLKLSEEV